MIALKNKTPYTVQQAATKLALLEADIYKEAMQSNAISLMQGIGGIPLLYNNLHAATGKKIYLEKNLLIIDRIIELLSTSISSLTYYQGLAGIGVLFSYLLKKRYRHLGLQEILDECDDVLFNAFFLATDDMDFLHGAQGIFMYFLNKKQCAKADKEKKEMMLPIISAANKYLTAVSNKDNISDVKINCGMAHGIVSYILIIAKYLSTCNCVIARETLYKLVSFLLKCETENKDSLSAFPSIIDYADLAADAKYIVPLGWCYGDNIISIALLKAGAVLQNNSLMNKAKEIALITAKRNNAASAIVHDACFCHGSAGIAHIYRKWYRYTGCDTFKRIYSQWINSTIGFCSFDDGIGGYKQFLGANNYESNLGLLDGACGVALVLSDYVFDKTTGWDSFFLLN